MSEVVLRDGSVTQDRRLDRLEHFDDRSRNYGIRTLVGAPPLKSKKWRCPVVLDQNREGACVGMTGGHELAASPMMIKGVTSDYAREQIYYEAQRNDPYPGGEYEFADPVMGGTGIIDGVKVLREKGFVTTFHWAFSEPELATGVVTVGPAWLGIPWYESMYETDADGWLQISGEVAGGHSILCNGFNVAGQYYILHNSWGPVFGKNGEAKISRTNMTKLLKDNGEVCFITGRQYITL